jgi:hypothetical protein
MVEDSIQRPVSWRPGNLWFWVALVVLVCFFEVVSLVRLNLREPRVPDNEPIPGEAEVLQDQAIRVADPDGFRTKATLDLPDGGRLEFRYGPINDSGVQLRRLGRRGGDVLWEQECAPLGVGHSEYQHDVFVQVEGRTLKVISRGSQGTLFERLDLDSGRRLARSVRKDRQ